MTRTLPAKPSLEYLKHEAKSIQKRHRARDKSACETLRHHAKFASLTDEDILEAGIKLLEVQQALAVEYGFDNWKSMKTHVESQIPRVSNARPVFGIKSYKEAVAHYVDWLGFELLWEWREAEGQPVIMTVARDRFELMLSEYGEYEGNANVHLDVKNLGVLAQEWNARRPGSVNVRIEPPYEFPDLPITDPFGNTLVFEEQNRAQLQKVRDSNRPKMRRFVQEKIDAGEPFPMPEEVREAIGPDLGTAIEVLNEFPGYRDAYDARQPEDSAAKAARSASHGLPSHLDLSVGDVTKSIAFYHPLLTALGYTRFRADDNEWQEPHPSRAAWGVRHSDGRAFCIDLRPATSNLTRTYDRFEPGPHHLALNVGSDSDIDDIYKVMLAANATATDLPANYGGQPGYGDHYYAVFFADPDGFKIEVVNARGLDA